MMDKMDQYRYIFQKELDVAVTEMGDSLIPMEQMKIFIFLQHLLKVGEYNTFSEEANNEYNILFFEIIKLTYSVQNLEKLYKKFSSIFFCPLRDIGGQFLFQLSTSSNIE